VKGRFPTIAAMCASLGLDIAADRIPVGPAAHYMMGGVDTDEWGRTSLRGLLAAGEVACTGVHGANRLASNSLLEGLVFGARAAAAMQEAPQAASLKDDRVLAEDNRLMADGSWLMAMDDGKAASKFGETPSTMTISHQPSAMTEINEGMAEIDQASREIRDLMWRDAGLFRSRDGLERAVRQLRQAAAAPVDDPRLRNLITVAGLMARAALRREESRGAHFRLDFPARDDRRWLRHIVDVRGTGRPG